jgi:hypothetical protein
MTIATDERRAQQALEHTLAYSGKACRSEI